MITPDDILEEIAREAGEDLARIADALMLDVLLKAQAQDRDPATERVPFEVRA